MRPHSILESDSRGSMGRQTSKLHFENKFLKIFSSHGRKYKARGDNVSSIFQILLINDVLGSQTVLGHTYVSIINKMYFAEMDLGFGVDLIGRSKL